METNKINLEDLKRHIPFKWRVQSFSKSKAVATCVAYIDSRSVMDLLDSVLGAENWQSDYKEIKGNLYAGIGIFLNGQWVWKWDCGTESQADKEKGEASDAFKRAAVKTGVGRFLYDQPMQYVEANEKKTQSNYPYCVDSNGKKIWDLTEHINKKLGLNNKANQEVKKPTDNVLNLEDEKKKKQKLEMTRDFKHVKDNGTVHDWTECLSKYMDIFPNEVDQPWFTTFTNKYKPNTKPEKVELSEDDLANIDNVKLTVKA